VTERHVAERLGTTHGVQALAGAALAGNSGAVTELASSVLQHGFLRKYSRDQELDADRGAMSRHPRRPGPDRGNGGCWWDTSPYRHSRSIHVNSI